MAYGTSCSSRLPILISFVVSDSSLSRSTYHFLCLRGGASMTDLAFLSLLLLIYLNEAVYTGGSKESTTGSRLIPKVATSSVRPSFLSLIVVDRMIRPHDWNQHQCMAIRIEERDSHHSAFLARIIQIRRHLGLPTEKMSLSADILGLYRCRRSHTG